MVDKESQRAAWTISGKNTPIMETGLQNLTMNETQALVHFADGTTQRWLLVRVEKPADQQAADGTGAAPIRATATWHVIDGTTQGMQSVGLATVTSPLAYSG